MADQPPLIVIVGPTGVGKTEIAVRLAQDLRGEIISADSRQVYRFMDIGTAKPYPDELTQARHHLVNILNPDETLSLAQFQRMAYDAIKFVLASGNVPLLVGGTGQYVKAVIEGWGIPEVPPNVPLRLDLETFGDVYGSTTLYTWLQRVDPPAAQSMDWRNVRRVVRALEVLLVSGGPISVLQKRHPPPYNMLLIGLTRPRDQLYERIDERIDRMIAMGMENEVRDLLNRGYSWGLPSMSSLGYPEIGAYLRGETTLDEAISQMKRETRSFVRRQYTWFNAPGMVLHWFDLSSVPYDVLRQSISDWLNGTRT